MRLHINTTDKLYHEQEQTRKRSPLVPELGVPAVVVTNVLLTQSAAQGTALRRLILASRLGSPLEGFSMPVRPRMPAAGTEELYRLVAARGKCLCDREVSKHLAHLVVAHRSDPPV